MEPLNVDKSLSMKHSLLTRYKMTMSDLPKESPSEEKTFVVFQMFHELVEHFGVFRELMVEIEKELVEAVYSQKVTTQASFKNQKLKRVPYFTLVAKMSSRESEQIQRLEDSKQLLQQRLFEKQSELEKIDQRLQIEKDERHKLEHGEFELKEKMRIKDREIIGLRAQIEKLKTDFGHKESVLQEELDQRMEEIRILTEERDMLRPFKEGYDSLENDCHQWDLRTNRRSIKKVIPANRKNHLLTELETVNVLENQLLIVQNVSIEDFDKGAEEHRRLLAQYELEKNHQGVEREDEYFLEKQMNFQSGIDQINMELQRLKVQSFMIKEQIQNLIQAEEAEKKNAGIPRAKRESVYDAISSKDSAPLNLSNTSPEILKDPFTIHERLLSKYSATLLFSSNGGRTYNEIKEAKYCPSCSEKVILCPHSPVKEETVFALPVNCTHMKVKRPLVKFTPPESLLNSTEAFSLKNAKEEKFGEIKKASAIPPATPEDSSGMLMSFEKTMSISQASETTSVDTNLDLFSSRFKYPLAKLIAEVSSRSPINRRIPRELNLDFVFSLSEQFWASTLWEDENGLEEQGYSNIMDKLFEFLYERYNKEDVVYLVAHDYVNSLLSHQINQVILQLVIHVFINNLDGAAFRYFMVLLDLVDQINWNNSEQMRHFVTIVYPDFSDDDQEAIFIEFVSHCENKLNPSTIANCFLYLILKNKESRILDMEEKLNQLPQNNSGYMTLQEYFVAMETLLPNLSESLAYRLFMESQLAAAREPDSPQGLVAVNKLAQIASYLELFHQMDLMKDKLNHLEDSDTNKSPAMAYSPVDRTLNFTYTKLRSLSIRQMRSAQYREHMILLSAGDDDDED